MRPFLAALLLLLWCAPLQAETLANVHDLAQAPRINAYIKSAEARAELLRLGQEQDKRLGLARDCRDQAVVNVKGLVLLRPVELPEGAAHPAQGAWQYRYTLERCGQIKIYNAVAVAGKDGAPPVFQPYFPGETLADVALVRDAMVPALAAAALAAKPDKSCRQVDMLDMRVVEGQKGRADAPWKEVWSILFCGRQGDAEISFMPDKDGKGTTFSAKPVGR